jgi:pimeloyl-ACP methyl ester carboxylesterase
MVQERDLTLPDGRSLRVYDSGSGPSRLTVFWHHTTPQTGTPPEPLLDLSARLGIRWLAHDRPGYGGSSPQPGRSVASAAADVACVAADAGVQRFAVLGASGGAPHALACAALYPERVLAVACLACVAPFEAEGLDWFAGMGAVCAAEMRTAAESRSALQNLLVHAKLDPTMFTPGDIDTYLGPYGTWLRRSGKQAVSAGIGGYLDDDLALVIPWGAELDRITAPVLFMHGQRDKFVPPGHSEWLAGQCRSAELRMFPDDSHISIFNQAESALTWLSEHA